jgi:hypothetical protein
MLTVAQIDNLKVVASDYANSEGIGEFEVVIDEISRDFGFEFNPVNHAMVVLVDIFFEDTEEGYKNLVLTVNDNYEVVDSELNEVEYQ